MSVIIRLQNLPWSANALDIRNFFRGLSIPEGGVHIVGGELGDAFIAFSTDEDARQGMMLDGGKIKEVQVKLLLSSRSEMHKVIEAARQSVPILTLAPVAPTPPTIPAPTVTPTLSAFTAALGNNALASFGIPGIGIPQEIPQPAVIEPPAPIIGATNAYDEAERDEEKSESKRSKDSRDRGRRSRSSSRSRDRKDRKRDRRDRSRSRERRRRDRSRSRERRGGKRDRKDRSRSRDKSPSRRSRDKRNKSPQNEKPVENQSDVSVHPIPPFGNAIDPSGPLHMQIRQTPVGNGPMMEQIAADRFDDPTMADAYNKLQELGKKRNPNAFQGDQNGGGRFPGGRNNHMGSNRGRGRFENDQHRDSCVAIRNAPTHTSYGDVRRFFPFMIDKHGIKMINDNMGRRTGNIFVRFCDARSRHLALQRKNNELKGSEVVVEPLDDSIYEAAVDSFLPYREDNEDDDQTLTIAEQEEPSEPPFTVLKITDLPHYVKEHDIIKMFSDFSLLSIILNDCRMSRSKTAYVQFAKPEDARVALEKKERYVFGRRHATAVAVSDEEYEKEKAINDKMNEPAPINEEVAQLEMPQQREPVIPRDPRQRRMDNNGPAPQGPTHQFFGGAPFIQPQQFAPAFVAPQFGAFPTGNIDPRAAAANWANRPTFNQMGPNNQMALMPVPMQKREVLLDAEPLDCVLMKGLPREATDRSIVAFLSDTGAVPARIHLMLDPSGLPSGDCFCEFRSSQEARMAATKHGHILEGCRVTVDLVMRSVVEEALETPKLDMRDNIMGNGPQQYFDGQSTGGFVPRGGYRGRGFDRGGGGGFDRGGYRGGFDSRGGYESRGAYRGRGAFSDRGDRGSSRGFDRGRGRGFMRGTGVRFDNGREMPVNNEEDAALEEFGAPGCVVSMENVPFRATVEEILDFFRDFELTGDDIIRRFNERGQPTGDARVAFRSPFDAERAIKMHHMGTIHERRISLTLL